MNIVTHTEVFTQFIKINRSLPEAELAPLAGAPVRATEHRDAICRRFSACGY